MSAAQFDLPGHQAAEVYAGGSWYQAGDDQRTQSIVIEVQMLNFGCSLVMACKHSFCQCTLAGTCN